MTRLEISLNSIVSSLTVYLYDQTELQTSLNSVVIFPAVVISTVDTANVDPKNSNFPLLNRPVKTGDDSICQERIWTLAYRYGGKFGRCAGFRG